MPIAFHFDVLGSIRSRKEAYSIHPVHVMLHGEYHVGDGQDLMGRSKKQKVTNE